MNRTHATPTDMPFGLHSGRCEHCGTPVAWDECWTTEDAGAMGCYRCIEKIEARKVMEALR